MKTHLATFCYCAISVSYAINLLCLELWRYSWKKQQHQLLSRVKFSNMIGVEIQEKLKTMHTATMITGEAPIIFVSLTSTSDICRICSKNIVYQQHYKQLHVQSISWQGTWKISFLSPLCVPYCQKRSHGFDKHYAQLYTAQSPHWCRTSSKFQHLPVILVKYP